MYILYIICIIIYIYIYIIDIKLATWIFRDFGWFLCLFGGFHCSARFLLVPHGIGLGGGECRCALGQRTGGGGDAGGGLVQRVQRHEGGLLPAEGQDTMFTFWVAERNIGSMWSWNQSIYSGFSHKKWWFSIVMLVYQRLPSCPILFFLQ